MTISELYGATEEAERGEESQLAAHLPAGRLPIAHGRDGINTLSRSLSTHFTMGYGYQVGRGHAPEEENRILRCISATSLSIGLRICTHEPGSAVSREFHLREPFGPNHWLSCLALCLVMHNMAVIANSFILTRAIP